MCASSCPSVRVLWVSELKEIHYQCLPIAFRKYILYTLTHSHTQRWYQFLQGTWAFCDIYLLWVSLILKHNIVIHVHKRVSYTQKHFGAIYHCACIVLLSTCICISFYRRHENLHVTRYLIVHMLTCTYVFVIHCLTTANMNSYCLRAVSHWLCYYCLAPTVNIIEALCKLLHLDDKMWAGLRKGVTWSRKWLLSCAHSTKCNALK